MDSLNTPDLEDKPPALKQPDPNSRVSLPHVFAHGRRILAEQKAERLEKQRQAKS